MRASVLLQNETLPLSLSCTIGVPLQASKQIKIYWLVYK